MSPESPIKRFWSISVGNVVSWVVIAAGFISWGARIADRVEAGQKEIVSLRRSVDDWTRSGLVTTVAEHDRRITTIETAAANNAATLQEIKTDVAWIKATLRAKP